MSDEQIAKQGGRSSKGKKQKQQKTSSESFSLSAADTMPNFQSFGPADVMKFSQDLEEGWPDELGLDLEPLEIDDIRQLLQEEDEASLAWQLIGLLVSLPNIAVAAALQGLQGPDSFSVLASEESLSTCLNNACGPVTKFDSYSAVDGDLLDTTLATGGMDMSMGGVAELMPVVAGRPGVVQSSRSSTQQNSLGVRDGRVQKRHQHQSCSKAQLGMLTEEESLVMDKLLDEMIHPHDAPALL